MREFNGPSSDRLVNAGSMPNVGRPQPIGAIALK